MKNFINMKQTVAVAMSGGADSSYALIKLKEEGYDVFGVTLKLFCYGETPYSPKSCCSLEAIKDAKSICSDLGVSHLVIDASEAFQKDVIDYFVNGYRTGLTPNPCVVCNSSIKWKFLLKKIISYGADFLATGHYATVCYSEEKQKFLLKCGLDKDKDQSYYLWALTQEQLSKTLLPLGEMRKEEVKEKLTRYNINISKKPESQEICFIPDNDYRGFLQSRGVNISEGNFLNSAGEIIGKHKGFPFYTIGQRRGLAVSHKERLYVTSIDTLKNEITLGAKGELYSKELVFSRTNFIYMPDEQALLKGRIRYRGKLETCQLKETGEGRYKVNFIEPVWAVCGGQSFVLYEGDSVVGGGIIEKEKDFS
ncbi:MAG: tRNA 2-thiouridine(34) synthase MnmA [Candidatus Eremiobacterota bacterium]